MSSAPRVSPFQRLAAGAACLVLCGLVLRLQLRLSERSYFNPDEAFQQVITCPEPVLAMLQGAKSQCSPAPLYYVLQKAYLAAVPIDHRILAQVRALSLAAAALTLGLVTWTTFLWLGTAPAAIAGLLVISQPLIHEFASQSRPYLVWVLLFTALVFALARTSARVAHSAGLVAPGCVGNHDLARLQRRDAPGRRRTGGASRPGMAPARWPSASRGSSLPPAGARDRARPRRDRSLLPRGLPPPWERPGTS